MTLPEPGGASEYGQQDQARRASPVVLAAPSTIPTSWVKTIHCVVCAGGVPRALSPGSFILS